MSHFGVISHAFNQSSEVNVLPAFRNNKIHADLEFDDSFESSNLFTAMHINSLSEDTYILTVRLDYNTNSYGQWFFFKVGRKHYNAKNNTQLSNNYRFMIINMTKSTSMFGQGLKISVCRKGVWQKEGINIKYYKNSLRKEDAENAENGTRIVPPSSDYYTL